MNNKSSDNVGAFFSAYLWLKEDGVNYREENAAILDRAGVPEGRRIYVSGTTPTVIAVFSRKEAEQIRREDRFMSFTPYGFDAPSISSEDVIPQQISADMIASEYNGTGVKVGVISAEGLRYDPFAKSLEGVKITELPTILPSDINTHPTAVISQIAGKRVEADGITFFGIAKEAEIYYASTRTSKGLYEAVEKMMELGVSVINYSAGKLSEEYTDLDRQIDRLIRNGNILFVTASGNRRPMTSPGRAYNGMTVGNAVTKERPNTPLAQPWRVWCQSEDSCSGYNDRGVHKPDLVAPGGWVGYVDRFGNADVNNFGTSFACPWVSAVAASLISSLGAPPSYLTLKAALLASCNAESLSDTDDPYVAKGIRLRIGYGMLDAEKALRIMREATVIEGVLSDKKEYSVTGMPEDSVTVMLVYEKGEDENGATLTVDGESYEVYEQNTLLIKKRSRGEVTLLSVYGKGNYRFSLLAFRTP